MGGVGPGWEGMWFSGLGVSGVGDAPVDSGTAVPSFRDE